MRALSALLLGALATVLLSQQAFAAFQLPPLPFEPNATEPVIDEQTNIFHHDVHHANYINRTNEAVGKYPDLQRLKLNELLARVGTGQLPQDVEVPIRNFGGGAWNHDLWWATLAPYNSTDTDPNTSLSPELSGALNSSFGGVSPFLDQFLTRAKEHFGSGWTWLIVKPDGGLQYTDTLNQDNPLMQIPGLNRGIPILGLDVWEHAYFLRYGPDKAAYVDAFPSVVNWTKVSDNYNAARSGDLSRIIGTEYDVQT